MTCRATVYVDGFNLYYGSLKRTPYRWLDLQRLSTLMLPGADSVTVKYFTAVVDSPSGSVKQRIYLSALEASGVDIHLGHFLSHSKVRPLKVPCGLCGKSAMEVVITEEKGTDVNLASNLVLDACTDGFDLAAVISNDSDLVTPILLARNRCNKTVGVINPQRHPARALLAAADFYKKLRPGVLAASQLPETMSCGTHVYRRPRGW